jgi:hypothetical protein
MTQTIVCKQGFSRGLNRHPQKAKSVTVNSANWAPVCNQKGKGKDEPSPLTFFFTSVANGSPGEPYGQIIIPNTLL